MVEKITMKGDSLQVQLDDTGDNFILLWRDKVGQVHITGPGTFHSGDIKVINRPPMPVKPPAEMPEVETASALLPHPSKPPIVMGFCAKYSRAIGKKPANSCVGCTIPGCKAKGKAEKLPDIEPQGF